MEVPCSVFMVQCIVVLFASPAALVIHQPSNRERGREREWYKKRENKLEARDEPLERHKRVKILSSLVVPYLAP